MKLLMKAIRFILCLGPVAGPAILIVLGLSIFGGALFSLSHFNFPDFFSGIGKEKMYIAPVISEIKKINRIYLLKVSVGFFDKQVATEGKVKKYRFTGELVDASSFYWQRVRGHALVSIDLKKLEVLEEDPERKHLKVKLPLPEMEAPTVNLDPKVGTVVYRKGYYWYTSQKVKDQFYKEAMPRAQRGIEKRVANPGYTKMAQEQAGEILEALFKPIGWSVEIQWDEPIEDQEGTLLQKEK